VSDLFARPWALALVLPALLPLALPLLRRRGGGPALRVPDAALLARAGRGARARLRPIPPLLAAAALALVAAALARPLGAPRAEARAIDGIDIVVALDLSSSMRAADFRPRDRLHVAKEVLARFVAARAGDRIGLVVFAAQAHTQAPLTADGAALQALVERVEAGAIEDGTAIGDAIATATNRLRGSPAESKAVILVTDGDDNASRVAPLDAARAAAAVGVKVFTILVGRGGRVPYPDGEDDLGRTRFREVDLPVNPRLLADVAAATGGAHYDAVDGEGLARGLHQILDGLARTRLAASGPPAREELAPVLLAAAFGLAAAATLLGATALRGFPPGAGGPGVAR
jgi:Ca-activated chloride channel family protein